MRIAFIGQRGVPATIGGVEHHVEEIGSRLAARGHEVTVYTRSNYTTTARVRRYRGMRVRYVPTAPTKRLEALIASGLSTVDSMAPSRHGPDIIHYHAIGPSVFSPLPRLLTRRGVVLTIHGLDYDRDKWGLGARTALRSAAWMSARVPHATITVSRNLTEYYGRHYARPAHYIPNGVSAPTRAAANIITSRWGLRGDDYLLFLGRLVPEKAPDLLVRAYRDVPGDARLVIAGGSSYTDAYVRTLEGLAALDPRVIMAGPVQGAVRDELYSNAAAFVLPSQLEGLPLTLLEAASYALPVIASDILPNVEIIGNDTPGARLFASGDERQLRDALAVTLAGGAAERIAARSFSQRVVRDYNWDAVTDATESLYTDVLARRDRRERL